MTEANLEDLSRVSQLRDVDLLFLQGGGNFGDLWPRHQHFRESVLRQFPQKKIVQLPQSIFFKDPDKLATATTIINGHPNFTLMVRDRVADLTARQQFTCQVVLTPDMAFMIGKVGRHARPDCKSLCLIRNDQESRFERRTCPLGVSEADGRYGLAGRASEPRAHSAASGEGQPACHSAVFRFRDVLPSLQPLGRKASKHRPAASLPR